MEAAAGPALREEESSNHCVCGVLPRGASSQPLEK